MPIVDRDIAELENLGFRTCKATKIASQFCIDSRARDSNVSVGEHMDELIIHARNFVDAQGTVAH